jgi:protein involved in polysaccharide export with SLBB domain
MDSIMKYALCVGILLISYSSFSILYAQSGTTEQSSPKKTSMTVESLMAEEHYKIGVDHFESKRFKEASNSFKQAVRLRPDWAEAHYYLGQAYYSLNKYREAADSYKVSVKLKPDWAKAHYRLGWAYYVLGKKQQSFDEHKILKELDPELASSLFRIIKDPSTPTEEENSTNQASQTEAVTQANKRTDSNLIASVSYPANRSQADILSNELTAEPPPPPPNSSKAPLPAKNPSEISPTEIYRVGLNDILDIRILNLPNDKSTLYRVLDNGTLDYPLTGTPFTVNGSTTNEIATKLKEELKRRSIHDDAQVMVTVREYVSHSVVISGLVNNPGVKAIRREAVPLYVLLAEAQPKAEAGRATIIRTNSPGIHIDLDNIEATSQLIYANDVINVSARPEAFYYVGGLVSMPGQKSYRENLTLMQAILSAGGVTPKAKSLVEISRAGADGKLTTTTFKLKDIKAGKEPDPKLQPGDLIEVR